MKLPSLIGAASLSVFCLAMARAASPAPADLALRNGTFVPAASIVPDTKTPSADTAMQDRRVERPTLDKVPAAIGDRRAAVEVQESREKNIREKTATRPESQPQALSTFNRRVAPVATASDTTQPAIVSKYQDGLKAASAANMARFPALDRATKVKLNRFVFRKNSPDPAPVTERAPVVPAGGGSPARN